VRCANRWLLAVPVSLRLWLALLTAGNGAQQAVGEVAPEPPAEQAPGGTPQRRYELLEPPQTPEELWDAARFMFRVGQLDDARGYLERFLKSKPPAELLVQIREGEDFVLLGQMRHVPALSEIVGELMRQAEEAARQRARDPARLQKMLSYLHRSPAHRRYAIEQLRAAGADAVPHFIAAIQALPEGPERARLVQTMGMLDRSAVFPLLAVLDSGDAVLMMDAVQALEHLGDPRCLDPLRYYAESPRVDRAVRARAQQAVVQLAGRPYQELPSAAEALAQRARVHYHYQFQWLPEPGGTVRLWRWVPREGLQATPALPKHADLYLAFRFAQQALELRPDERAAQVLLVASALALAKQSQAAETSSLPQWTVNVMATAGPDVLLAVVDESLRSGRAAAARAALEAWGELASPVQSVSNSPRFSPLWRALTWPDPRVRFAAVEAVLKGKPARPWPAATQLLNVLATFLVEDLRSRKVLLVAQDPSWTVQWSKQLREEGVELVQCGSLPDAMRAVREIGLVEAILLRPPLRGVDLPMVVAALGSDIVSRSVPVVLLVPAGEQDKWAYLERQEGCVVLVRAEPMSPPAMAMILSEAVARGGGALSPEERKEYAGRAAEWIVRVARGEIPALDITPLVPRLIAQVRTPHLSGPVAEALAHVDDARAQKALLELAADGTLDPSARLVAARAARLSLRRYGQIAPEPPAVLVRQALQDGGDTELSRELRLLFARWVPPSQRSWLDLRLPPVPEASSTPSSRAAPP
jgi:hypothetical protein